MDYKYYERKINDVIMKCPIEAGVEILVYNVLDSILDAKKVSLVDINRLWKNKDNRLTTEGGISDIAILPTDFVYKKPDTGVAYGFIEVKATNKELLDTEQILGQKARCPHYIYTNGLVWKYFLNGTEKWEIKLAMTGNEERKCVKGSEEVSINNDKFNELIQKLSKIVWISE